MSISYNFDMAVEQTASQVAHELCDIARTAGLFDESVTPELVLDDGALTTKGTWICVGEQTPQPWNPVITDLGFTPTVWVRFQLARSSEHSDQEDDMVRLVSGLLDRTPGDAVLHFQFEVIWLLRRGSEVSLNERSDVWPPHRLAAVSQTFHRATHEFAQE
ncbi:SitI3 family protein [Streptomyces brevispora]|uniref:SitI3 family protein n=1 Tax=Streptomyces brevispora TaxID=887462 RepID=A0ABZ1GBI7_9ACTN|nr:SitI3 family protein [Streptomyces brevispora]WSC16663.1 SitI3 family protein [Streptomyces brevispora]